MTRRKKSDVGEPATARPLTRVNALGLPYERPPAVQQEIETALVLEPEVLLASADNLRDETLVYLIRERRRVQDWSVANRLSQVLLERCKNVILGTLHSFPPDVRDEAIRTVLEQLFTRIIALDNERGDFYQVRFGLALKRLSTSAFRQCVLMIAQQRRAEHDDEGADSRNAPFDPYQWPEDAVDLKDALKGLEAIRDAHHRMAFVLRVVREMPIVSDDPETVTISRYFDVSPRTITNWLDQAEADLARWRRGMS